jgi:hypothetical protein
MTEENLAQPRQSAAIGRRAGLFLAALGILGLALWLFRQPIAETIARSVCGGQSLTCKLSITRLDLGGITLTDIDARAPGTSDAALTAREIVITFAWTGPFSLRPTAVSGDQVTVRLDLTGKRSLFGDLETAITNFTKPDDALPQPPPRLAFTRVTLIGDTLSGPVYASGTIMAAGNNAFVVDIAATPTSLGLVGGTMELSAARLRVRVAGEEISAALKVDLANFVSQGVRLADVQVDATLQQSAGVLKGEGAVQLGTVSTETTSLSATQAMATVESAAIGGETFSLGAWLSSVRRLQVNATTGEGAVADIAWSRATLATLITPSNSGSGGDLSLIAEGLSTPQALAGRIDIAGKVQVDGDTLTVSDGEATISSAMLRTQQRAIISDLAAGALASVLPSFGEALRATVDRAAQNFSVSTPWSASATSKGALISLSAGATLKAASGLTLAVSTNTNAPVATFNATEGAWTAAGALSLRGGGAPPVSINLAKAEGTTEHIALSGAAKLRSWRVGADTLSAELTGLDLSSDAGAGAAAGHLSIRLDGALAGGVWKGVRATAEVVSHWHAASFIADAPEGAVIEWQSASYGDTNFGAAALRYTPIGRLAQRTGDDLVGQGRLAAVRMPVTGDGYSADVVLGAADIGWRTAGGFRANLDAEPWTIGLKLDERPVPIRIEGIKGVLDLTRGWKITGTFDGGSVKTEDANVADLTARFDLSGQGNSLSGALTGVAMRIFDPNPAGAQRFSEASFRGEGYLQDSALTFTGAFNMAKSGVQVAQVRGRHDLDTGAGGLSFEPTLLIFRPRQFQPEDLSPLLIGPANVTGRLDIGGAATWDADGFKASGVLDLKKLGFVLASAGVFEGVSGRIDVADLFNLKSSPGQRISIDKVTFGLPIEKGTIDFQLVGFDAIQLERAEWPFVGGFIRVDPDLFAFSSSAENRIVARAVNWDLAVLADQFKLPDLKLAGVVGGEFPVVFTTGSAKIDNAVLKSVMPGVIQYSGSPGDAAAQADENSKMLFDALKDFRYEVLEVGLDGNLTGQMLLKLSVLGRNPDVLGGQPFQLNIGIDSALVPLLTSTFQKPDIGAAIEQAQEQREREARH